MKNMVKKIVLTAPASTNTIAAGDFLETDGSGYVKAFDGTGTVLGNAESNKNTNNIVGVIKQGVIRVPTVNATYVFGAQVEWVAAQKVQAYSAGVIVGTVAENKTTTTADNYLSIYVNFA